MAEYDPDAVPRLARGMKFRHDPVRDAWVLLGPERLFLPDEPAVAVLRLIDGERRVADIVDTLSEQYRAPVEIIAGDVWEMLSDLGARGAVRLG